MSPLLRCLILAACLLGAGMAARAQVVSPEETSAQRCVRLIDGARMATPEYPFSAFKQGLRGRVSVDLVFAGPQAEPTIERLTLDGDNEFEASVRRFVAGLRVPCIKAGEAPARLRYEYVFKGDERRAFASPPEDPNDTPERFACMTPLPLAAYPKKASEEGTQGRVLVRFRFEAPDQPAQFEVLSAKPLGSLATAVRRHFASVRMPCIGDQPVSGEVVYVFLFTGEDRFGFGPHISFQQFVGSLRPADRERLPADSRGMGCPFDVRVNYRQPATDHRVYELGEHDPRRQPMLAWLRSVRLADAQVEPSVFADDVTFEIPCYQIQ